MTVLTETPSTFELLLDSPNGVNSDCSFPISAGTAWVADVTVDTVDGAHDLLTISGTVVHASPPHGEGANPSPLPFSVTIDAGSYGEGTHVEEFMVSVPHGTHTDVLTGTVSFFVFVEAIFDFHFIFDYAATLTASHSTSVPALPPTGLGLLIGAVLLSAGVVLRRHRRGR